MNITQNLIGTIMKREYIDEVAWSKILKFLRAKKNIYIGDESRCKNFFEAVYWMSRTGAQWRELHDKYGNWNSIFKRFNAWSKKGIWDELFESLSEDPDLEYVMLDATIVRAHACAAGYGKQETQGLGRSAGGFTSKIHVKVDALGNPLKFVVTPGQTNEITQAQRLLGGITDASVIADKAYGAASFRDQIRKQKCKDVIPSKVNSLNPTKYDKHIYKERNLVECYFGKMKHFRRVFSRFDKTIQNFKAFLLFVGTCLWLR